MLEAQTLGQRKTNESIDQGKLQGKEKRKTIKSKDQGNRKRKAPKSQITKKDLKAEERIRIRETKRKRNPNQEKLNQEGRERKEQGKLKL